MEADFKYEQFLVSLRKADADTVGGGNDEDDDDDDEVKKQVV